MKISKTFLTVAVLGLILSACTGGEPAPTAFPDIMVDGSSAYLASNLHVYKFDINNASESWRFPAQGATATSEQALPGPFSGKPLKFGNVIVVGDSTGRSVTNHYLYGLKESDGTVAWRFSGGKKEYTDGVESDGKVIYAPNGDGSLYAIDPNQKDGSEPKLLWKFTTQNKLWTRPLVAEGTVYQAALDHRLYAIDAATGKEKWQFRAAASIAVQPVLVDGILYFGSFDSKFYAIKAADGSKVWEREAEGWIWCDPLIEDGTIYVGNVRGAVFALNQADGQVKWRSDVADTVHGQPVRQGNKLYVMSMNTYVYVIDLSATPTNGVLKAEIFNDKIGRRLLSTPVIANNHLLVPLFDGDVKVSRISLESKLNESFFPVPTATK